MGVVKFIRLRMPQTCQLFSGNKVLKVLCLVSGSVTLSAGEFG